MPIADYTIDNLLLHFKALAALGLWKGRWEEVAGRLGCEDHMATIDEIDAVLFERISKELNIDFDVEWGEAEWDEWWKRVAKALRLKGNITLKKVIDAFCERQHSRKFRVVMPLQNGELVEMPEDVFRSLCDLFLDSRETKAWLTTENDHLDGRRPVDLLDSDIERVRSELQWLWEERESQAGTVVNEVEHRPTTSGWFRKILRKLYHRR